MVTSKYSEIGKMKFTVVYAVKQKVSQIPYILGYKTHPDLALKINLLAKPAYKTHLNGELRKTFFKVKTGGGGNT